MNPSDSDQTKAGALSEGRLFALVCLLLTLGTVALYWPITRYPFIHFDDDDYIVGNVHVTSGLGATNLVWAFTTSAQANWHPLTWISHQTDGAMFGLNPGAHHLVNLLYHVANTLLLFVFLRSSTGALWRAALVAALFAWHPMHVESVAWASERKDVLSTFFWLLAMLAYLCYARSVPGADPAAGRSRARAALWYGAALALCACGLMSKPMVVTLPCALLLLDLWPLDRMAGFRHSFPQAGTPACEPVSVGRLIWEKIPFLALAVAGSLATYYVQAGAGAVAGLPLGERLANAVLAYARYTSKLFWPTDLAIIYPHPRHWPAWLAAGAVLLLVAWTFSCVYHWRKAPYLVVGWFWFLGTLVPTIGLIQVGAQAMADRYTYIPSIGLFIVVTWGVAEFFAGRGGRQIVPPLLAGAVLIGCLAASAREIGLWRDSITLFHHAVEVTTDNYAALNCLGKAYELVGQKEKAYKCYDWSVSIEPRFPYSQFNLAMAQLERGKTTEALGHLQVAAGLEPRDADIQYDLGIYFSQHDSWTNALNCFSNSVSVRPDFAPAQMALGSACANLGRAAEAARRFRLALRLDPKLTVAQTNLDRLTAEHPEVR